MGPHSLRRTYATIPFAVGDDPVYVTSQIGHTEVGFSMKVYARAVKRRSRLSGAHLREFDAALVWARMSAAEGGLGTPMGTNGDSGSMEDAARGLLERLAD